MTASEKMALLVDQAKILRIKFEAAMAGGEEWAAVRHQHGQVRRTLRSIQGTLHGIARKIHKQKKQDDSSKS